MTDGAIPGDPERRRLLQALLGGVALSTLSQAVSAEAGADADAGTGAGAGMELDPEEVIELWPDGPPGGVPTGLAEEIVERPNDLGLRDRIIRHVTQPRLTVFRPDGRPRGALLLLPGGGYRHVVVDKEGFETARWLAQHGLIVFVLYYRLPADGWAGGPDAPLEDAQRAMRMLRERASHWQVDPRRIGVIGFSAGGHLAAMLACRFDQPMPGDGATTPPTSARPDLTALIYPVIAMDDPLAHAGSREQLLGPAPGPALIREYSADTRVPAGAPPTFILHAGDDASVPPGNALRMAAALRAVGTPVDLHLYSIGGHGFGLRYVAGKPVAAWPHLLNDWLAWRYSA